MEVLQSEMYSTVKICVGLFDDVENPEELKAGLKDLRCCFINPSLVCSSTHLLIAVNRALFAQENSSSKTKSVYLDIVYYLSGSSNIRETLQKFGISDSTKSFILLAFSDEDYLNAKQRIIGTEVKFDKISELVDLEIISKEFKINQIEKNMNGGIFSAVYGKIAIKDI